MPAYTCVAVAEAARWAGYRPVFADIDAQGVNMTRDTLAAGFTSGTTAVVLTHQFGVPCDVDAMLPLCRRRGVFVVEDAAAAIGAKYGGIPVGSFGDAAVVSFQRTKVVAADCGGALMLDDDRLAKRVLERSEKWPGRGVVAPLTGALAWAILMSPTLYSLLVQPMLGLCGKGSAFQVVRPGNSPPKPAQMPATTAALCARQMPRLAENVAQRRRLARVYEASLTDVSGVWLPRVEPKAEPAWIQYPIAVGDRRTALCRHLAREGFDAATTFRYSCTDTYGLTALPNAAWSANAIVGLPTYPSLSEMQAAEIAESVKRFAAGRGAEGE
jgi:dTDP-4-amino-4,6-dideoxygalactose transaminase